MSDRSKPKFRCSSSIINRWTCSSSFDVQKMMFEFDRWHFNVWFSSFQLMLYNILVLGLDVLRVWIGPLPPWLCTSYIVLKGFLYNSFTLVLFTLTVMKYVFLCILKRVPEMNDELVTRIVIGGVCIWSALELCAKFLMFPGKPVVNEVSSIHTCNNQFKTVPIKNPNWLIIKVLKKIDHE